MLERLFKWENLESLVLSNNIIKGTLPKMAYGVPKYTKRGSGSKRYTENRRKCIGRQTQSIAPLQGFTYRLKLPAWRPSRLALTPPLPNVLVT